jgi:hypothetical protein
LVGRICSVPLLERRSADTTIRAVQTDGGLRMPAPAAAGKHRQAARRTEADSKAVLARMQEAPAIPVVRLGGRVVC